MTAVLGLGTYRVRVVAQAARTALAAGASWVDTAPNYADGFAHQQLAQVAADYPDARMSTKTGFHTAAQGRAAVAAGVLTADEAAGGHSLAPTFIRWQTERALRLLGRANLVFVHNPERVGHDRAQVQAELREAFAVLEEFAQSGQIGGYGVATWSGLASGAFTVPDLLGLAGEAAGSASHHFTGLQLPVSLVMADPMVQALNGSGPLVQAQDAGVITFASAPLHGGELPGLMTPELAEFIRAGLSAPAAALLAVASCPGLDVVLVSASTPEHWDDAAKAVAVPLAPERLRSILDELATG
ncbi:aldo/keto reductase [Streptomyces kaniharaensis]|uniref:Aldo/keto reductase n=1 Tax=Streptomyces kaniharaensis TaxID=212423 RepID=A0A6N7KNQ4_9ACTN|nr:aldo/keto reductase [Streptomyces kaniharaensis]MQS13041.1 aldo/keto reductase [Streptomyces kaniharaensis]